MTPAGEQVAAEAVASLEGEEDKGGPQQPRVPHRWRVVIMMALAFVLCNMDKVSCAQFSARRAILASCLCSLAKTSSSLGPDFE